MRQTTNLHPSGAGTYGANTRSRYDKRFLLIQETLRSERAIAFLLASYCGYRSKGMVGGQPKDDESGQVQADKSSLVSGGLLRMISPVSDTFK